MARRDQTGPMGEGAMTGRGLGVCNGVEAEMNRPGMGQGPACRGGGRRPGRGGSMQMQGAGRGGRMGFNNNYSQPTRETLEGQKETLQNRLDAINAELAEG